MAELFLIDGSVLNGAAFVIFEVRRKSPCVDKTMNIGLSLLATLALSSSSQIAGCTYVSVFSSIRSVIQGQFKW